MSNQIITLDESHALMPAMSVTMATQRRAAIVEFTQALMVADTDYGVIPGTNKPTLFKPGAEKLCTLFGLSPFFELTASVEDWTGDAHGGEPFFHYRYRCTLKRGEHVAGQGEGACNSWERKYRYRTAQLTCPECGSTEIRKSKHPPREAPDAPPGWFCWAKVGGCGGNFAHNDQRITNQERGKIKNDNPADIVNTIVKMAQKRALIAATLIAVNASEFYAQDIEDMAGFSDVVEGEWSPVVVEEAPRNGRKAPAPVKHPPQPNPAPPAAADDMPLFSEDARLNEAITMARRGKWQDAIAAIRLHPRYADQHTKQAENALKKVGKRLGFTNAVNMDEGDREVLVRSTWAYASARDAGMSDSRALHVAVTGELPTDEEE